MHENFCQGKFAVKHTIGRFKSALEQTINRSQKSQVWHHWKDSSKGPCHQMGIDLSRNA